MTTTNLRRLLNGAVVSAYEKVEEKLGWPGQSRIEITDTAHWTQNYMKNTGITLYTSNCSALSRLGLLVTNNYHISESK